MSKSVSNPTTPVSLRRLSPSDCITRIPQLAALGASAATPTSSTLSNTTIPTAAAVPKLRRSLSLRMRSTSSCSANTASSTTRNHLMTDSDIDSIVFGGARNSSNLHTSTDTTDNINCKSYIKRSPIGASCPAINKKHSTNGVAGSDCSPTSATNHRHREHGLQLNLNNRSSAQRSPLTPRTPSGHQSLSKETPKTPPATPDSPLTRYERDDDLDSMYSYSSITSCRSTMSTCEHPYVARNGTTFSGRKMKYVVHCSSYAGQSGEEYLTPTQRAQRHIHRLKVLLSQARLDLEQRDSEILRLTKEVVELRLFKASLSSPEDRSNSSDAVTVRENNDMKTSQDVSPIVDMADDATGVISKSSSRHLLHNARSISQVQYNDRMCNSSEMHSSYADSGHFEDITTSSTHSKDSFVPTGCEAGASNMSTYEQQHRDIIQMYEQRIEELIRKNDEEALEMKTSYTEKVEGLLQKLSECNTRYADIVPDFEEAKERIIELEKQLEELQRKLDDQEDKQNKMYLHMYKKEQDAEKMSSEKMLEFAKHNPNRVSVPELIQQLQVTQNELDNLRDVPYETSEAGSSQVLLSAKEAISLWLLGARKTMYRRLIDAQNTRNKVDPEVTLQFLKSAVYYFFTDKENSQGHLNAIESILGFSDMERLNIERAISNK